MSEYTELLRNDPGERLAWLAHSVGTPFTNAHRESDNAYPIVVRDIGEQLAAGPTLYGEEVMEGAEVLHALKVAAIERGDHHSQRFLGDELAMAHAATVYRICTSQFESCLSDIDS